MKEKEKFNVFTLTSIDDKNKHCDDLTMVIIKDGVKVKLNSEEIHQVINSIPRTFGGIY